MTVVGEPTLSAESPIASEVFTHDFQVSIIKLVVRDAEFSSTILPLLNPQHFSRVHNGDYLRDAVFWAQHWQATNTGQGPLPVTIFDQWAFERLSVTPAAERAYAETAWRFVSYQLYEEPVKGEQFIRERSLSWIQKAEERRLLDDAKIAIDSGASLESIDLLGRAREISGIPMSAVTLGVKFGFDHDEVLEWAKNVVIRDIMPSGFTKFDEICSGGMARREMWVIAAPPNLGKTTICAAFAGAYAMRGRFVVYYTMEQTRDQILEKIICSLAKCSIESLRADIEAMRSWSEYIESTGGMILVQEFPTKSADVSDIANHLNLVKHKFGREPDVVVVDYPDDMRHDSAYGDMRHDIAGTYMGLRGLAFAENFLLIAPSQINREGAGKERAGIESLAEAYQKGAIADGVIVVHQSEEERRRGILRMFFAKNRVGEKFREVSYTIGYVLTQLEEQVQSGISAATLTQSEGAEALLASANLQAQAQTYQVQPTAVGDVVPMIPMAPIGVRSGTALDAPPPPALPQGTP